MLLRKFLLNLNLFKYRDIISVLLLNISQFYFNLLAVVIVIINLIVEGTKLIQKFKF